MHIYIYRYDTVHQTKCTQGRLKMYKYTHSFVRMHTSICMYAYIYLYVCIQIDTYIYLYVCIHLLQIDACIHLFVCMHTPICMYAYIN